jgi:hypothetical protein
MRAGGTSVRIIQPARGIRIANSQAMVGARETIVQRGGIGGAETVARGGVAARSGSTHIGYVDSECRREIDLMLLLLHKNLANLLGHRVFTQCFALPDACTVVADRLVFVVEIEA